MATNDPDLRELRECFEYDTSQWQDIRDEGTTDMRYAAGDPWDPKDRTHWEDAGRLCLSADEIGQYVNQGINDLRTNKLAVKFTPSGNGATDKTAEFYSDKMREIEYRSRASIGYITAAENMFQRSYGFVRVNARYATSRAVNQDLWVDPVPNPNLITPDPQALMPDLSDMKRCWVREAWSADDFDARWTDYKIGKTQRGALTKIAPSWVQDRLTFVGEYWKIKTKPRTLLVVQPPTPRAPGLGGRQGQTPEPLGLFEDELKDTPLPGTLIEKRQVDDPYVVKQLTNGIEILEETAWPGRYIPIIGCLGKVMYVEEDGLSSRQILSMIRLARDPQMLYAYLVSCEAELIGMTPKFPYFARKGSLDTDNLAKLAKSLHEPVAVIEVEASLDGLMGQPPEFPQRQPYEPPLQAIEIAKEAARRAIQAAMGQTPLPTAAQRRTEKSGVALKRIDEMGQRGSFHFKDHYLDMITHVGVVCEDLIPHYYDSVRKVGIRRANDTAAIVTINDTNDPESISPTGDHLVTVSTGPSFESQRDADQDMAMTLLGSDALLKAVGPQKTAAIYGVVVRAQNPGPYGDEIAEIISPKPSEDGQPSPQQIQQLMQENQALKQQLGQAAKAIQGKQVEKQAEQQGKLQIATLQESAETQRNRENNETRLAVAELGAKVDRLALFFEERERLGVHDHDRRLAAADAGHEEHMADLAHRQALTVGAQQHAQGLEAQQQQAALEPPAEGA